MIQYVSTLSNPVYFTWLPIKHFNFRAEIKYASKIFYDMLWGICFGTPCSYHPPIYTRESGSTNLQYLARQKDVRISTECL